MDRYSRNMEMLTMEENISLRSKKIAVIGGGAAGMFAALNAAERGCEVHLFEKNEKPAVEF